MSNSDTDEVKPSTSFGAFRKFAYESTEGVDVAEDFHEASKITRATASRTAGPAGAYFLYTANSHLAVGYPRLFSTGTKIALPPVSPLETDLTEVGQRRRSGIEEPSAELSFGQLGQLLGRSVGARRTDQRSRVVPSAGWLHPIDYVIFAYRVKGLAPAAYLLDTIDHCLRLMVGVDHTSFYPSTTLDEAQQTPAAVISMVATFARSRAKYGLRGYRFCLLEAGHAAQSLVFTATAMGLQSKPVGGFIDTAADDILLLDGVDQSCLYQMYVAGSRKETDVSTIN